jgi:uncharacterized protein (UPF0128 family)
MRELFQQREAIKKVFLKNERAVLVRKERLFKLKDYKAWGCTAVSLDEIRPKAF